MLWGDGQQSCEAFVRRWTGVRSSPSDWLEPTRLEGELSQNLVEILVIAGPPGLALLFLKLLGSAGSGWILCNWIGRRLFLFLLSLPHPVSMARLMSDSRATHTFLGFEGVSIGSSSSRSSTASVPNFWCFVQLPTRTTTI